VAPAYNPLELKVERHSIWQNAQSATERLERDRRLRIDTPAYGRIAETLDRLGPELRSMSLAIHARPELAFEERFAAETLTAWLAGQGFDVERPYAGLETAFLARKPLGSPGPRVAFIAEYDALPGIGHGCGHNLICVASVAAATALAGALEGAGVGGEVAVIGTPGEEGGGGKVIMLERGAFEGVDAALMFHPGNRTMVVRGSLAATRVTMRFRGKAAHAASNPHLGVNALDACIQTFNAINALRQHVKDETRVHGVITNGGAAPNIVPDYAEAKFIIRHRRHDYMLEVRDKVFAAARHAAAAVGATVELEEGVTYKERVVNHAMAARFGAHLESLGEAVKDPPVTGGVGSSDFGNLSQEVPAIHPYVQIVPEGVSAHTAEFAAAAASEAGLRAMDLAARCLAMTGHDLLVSAELLAEARREFAATVRDREEGR